MSDEPAISPETAQLRQTAEAEKKKAMNQLVRAVRIRRGTEEVRRINGIAAALNQRHAS